MIATKQKTGGLAGIVAGDSAICLCSAEDENLLYRGYSIEELAREGTFEETSYLLLNGELPNNRQLASFKSTLKKDRDLPKDLKKALELIPPKTNKMDLLRTGCSLLGNFEPPNEENINKVAQKLLSCLGSMLFYWHRFHETGERIDLNSNEESLAGNILFLMQGKKPNELAQRCLDVSLILYAEHEFNASTFTVRTIASTLSDIYSSICGGIGALRGPLHGGANEWAMALLEKFNSPDEAERGVKEMLARKELVMGFGHRVYTTADPRSTIIKEWAKKMAQAAGDKKIFPIAERIEMVMWDEKKLFPNLDFYSAVAYHFCGIDTSFFTPLFVLSRITGWCAHYMEQHSHNKLIRPISNYIGPNQREWKPINQR